MMPRELVDPAPIVVDLQRLFLGNQVFTNLPRTFNVAVTGCPDNRAGAETQGIAMTPALPESNEAVAFNLSVGGTQGPSGPVLATPKDGEPC
jgi:ferredoxin-nitrite reductase